MVQTSVVLDTILNFLKRKNLNFDVVYHEPTPTSLDSANVRGMNISEGIKAIVVKTSKTFDILMFCLPGDKKINNKYIRTFLNQDFSFADKDYLLKKYNLIQGGIPPLGFLFGITTYLDPSIFENNLCGFNAGLQTVSVIMQISEFKKLEQHYKILSFAI